MLADLMIRDLALPWLMSGAAASGVLSVARVEALQPTKLVQDDAAIERVFSALFALAAILATLDQLIGTESEAKEARADGLQHHLR